MIRNVVFFVLFLVFLGVCSHASTPAGSLFFRHAEDSLVTLANRIPAPPADETRMEYHSMFSDYLEEVLMHDHAFEYPFDSLQTVSLLYAPDSTFRMITWYVPLSGRRFHYAGFVQLPGQGASTPELIQLQDATAAIDNRETAELTAGNWYGAFYYEIIRQPGMDHHILLGWKGHNPQTRKRVIEPFSIVDGNPVFGQQVFGEPFEDARRVVFEYSSRVSMSLMYETNEVSLETGAHPMIVFDRLEPTHHSLQGHYQFYKPEVNIFDGFYFDGNKWKFAGDVDVRMRDPE